MGGLPWDVAARDLPVPEAISQRRAALGIPQATPRAQEAPPQAAKRGQGQACGDGQTAPDTQDQSTKRSKSVYNIISTQGWYHVLTIGLACLSACSPACHSQNGLPDPACTPGAADPRVTQDQKRGHS